MNIKGFVKCNGLCFHNQVTNAGVKALIDSMTNGAIHKVTHVFLLDSYPIWSLAPNGEADYSFAGSYSIAKNIASYSFVSLGSGLISSFGTSDSVTDYKKALFSMSLGAAYGIVDAALLSRQYAGAALVMDGDVSQSASSVASPYKYVPNGNETLLSIVSGNFVKEKNTVLNLLWELSINNL